VTHPTTNAGDWRTAAKLITRIESGDASVVADLKTLYINGLRPAVLGITGPPGAGKSTLVDHLISNYRARGERVAVLAVDPSSPFTGGAILGDRVRMSRHNTDAGVFIRSMAARGRLGGLSGATGDAITVLQATGVENVLVETVGVGQSEVEILRHAHTVLIVQTPAGGDAVQAVKAGLLEVGDVFAVNKADIAGADRTVNALRESVEFRYSRQGDEIWRPPVLKTQASEGTGIGELIAAIDAHRRHFEAYPDQMARKLKAQARALLIERLAEALRVRYGRAEGSEQRFEFWLGELVARRTDPFTAVANLMDAEPTGGSAGA
jgi:LAO/AO transport system kinase